MDTNTRCAVVQLTDGLVVNIIMASVDDVAPENCELIEILPEQMCNIGWYYDGTTFIDPNPSGE